MPKLAAGLVVSLLFAAGCQSSTSPPRPSNPAQPATLAEPTPPQPSCPTTIPGDELQGQAPPGGSLWALLFSRYPLPRATEVKIVWRMTGQGAFTINATGPNGQHVSPKWGPESHGGSTWNKPGSEWGTGFIFPTSGCWALWPNRGNDHGSIGLLVN